MQDGLLSARGPLFIRGREIHDNDFTTKDISRRSNIVKVMSYKEFCEEVIRLIVMKKFSRILISRASAVVE